MLAFPIWSPPPKIDWGSSGRWFKSSHPDHLNLRKFNHLQSPFGSVQKPSFHPDSTSVCARFWQKSGNQDFCPGWSEFSRVLGRGVHPLRFQGPWNHPLWQQREWAFNDYCRASLGTRRGAGIRNHPHPLRCSARCRGEMKCEREGGLGERDFSTCTVQVFFPLTEGCGHSAGRWQVVERKGG